MMLALIATLTLGSPIPFEMPKASAYLVSREDGYCRLEDRYDTLDLWFSREIDGIWRDDDGSEMMFATLDMIPPATEFHDTLTRVEYGKKAGSLSVRTKSAKDEIIFDAIDMLSPIVPNSEFSRPRQKPRNMKDVRYYQGTNETAIVCAYLRNRQNFWHLVTLTLAEGEEIEDIMKELEDDLSDRNGLIAELERDAKHPIVGGDERELLRSDVKHSVGLYDDWRVTDSEEFMVVDDLSVGSGFITALTNDLKVSRLRYAEVMPSPIDGSNVLAVARIFASRSEYLEAAGGATEWNAAYWSPSRRELVAYLPEGDTAELMRTIRHEAFHQYFSYACAMIPSSPWLNEGYAQYFEDENATPPIIKIENYSAALPALMMMDYDEFYAGTDEERVLHYQLAWSIAIFMEKGAREVRFDPFKNLKSDYLKALLDTKDMRKATSLAFKNSDTLKLFIAEWKKFWKNH